MMDKIAIFCSASENIEPVFFEKARELGVWMGQNKKTLVYGGANIGLMECCLLYTSPSPRDTR